MNVRNVVKRAVICGSLAMVLCGSASAQRKGMHVSDALEPGPAGVISEGVSAARCGRSLVVGFGDAESGNASSFAGYAVSNDGGKSFRDLGVLPVSPEDSGFGTDVLGFGGTTGFGPGIVNVSLACGSSEIFYYASTFLGNNTPQDCPGFPICSAISVSVSKDGGSKWSLPIQAASGSIDSHDLSSPSIAVDPRNPRHVYVAYLETNGAPLDSDFFFPECDGFTVTELRLASSQDGGTSWTPHIVDHACDFSFDAETNGTLATPKVTIAADGKVYLAYQFQEFTDPGVPPVNEIRFTKSLDQGRTFIAALVVSTEADADALPQIAVDRTKSPHHGAIYLTWSGSPVGTSENILASDSLDEGASFSFPRVIDARPGVAATQTSSVLAVDKDGQIEACFYQTAKKSPITSSVYWYECATSTNHAATWHTRRLAASVPAGLGALTSDYLLQDDGFFAAFVVQTGNKRQVEGEASDPK